MKEEKRKNNRERQRKIMYASIIALFVYYAVIFILNIVGVISKKWVTILLIPVIAGVLLLNLFRKK